MSIHSTSFMPSLITEFCLPVTATRTRRSFTLADRFGCGRRTMSNHGATDKTRCALRSACLTARADQRSKSLTSQGKIPHDLELEKHPEKSLEGRMWLMGDVSALIKASRPETHDAV